ncbi:CRISPR-associated protein Cas4 [Roseomonas marmotae]|uniref:Dna2/Cas4 domain-containing protein n=1 Tax=Roseomonas marmotae TaxID=2768161 RepID=A0ABS3KI00_9PROT|nr:Dna2/Cas4 domain-containing protein [Roseomonas marmotae]MBO1077094.1 Dna2/Cas4 domain-containing protein [Roseomonas marmotae]QTI82158.1 Dna2/Cas4 domain-containing protein [Roseomonas marmotae]
MSTPVSPLATVRRFAEIVTRADLSGLAFQHLALCRRRAWLHLQRIDYAHLDEHMQRGLALHDMSRPRDHSVAGLIGLAPDRIDWSGRQVYEAKGSAGAADAVSRQGAFYALMLWAAQGKPWQAIAHILPAKRERSIMLDPKMVNDMLEAAEALEALRDTADPPTVAFTSFCAQCSYRHLCGVG